MANGKSEGIIKKMEEGSFNTVDKVMRMTLIGEGELFAFLFDAKGRGF